MIAEQSRVRRPAIAEPIFREQLSPGCRFPVFYKQLSSPGGVPGGYGPGKACPGLGLSEESMAFLRTLAFSKAGVSQMAGPHGTQSLPGGWRPRKCIYTLDTAALFFFLIQ